MTMATLNSTTATHPPVRPPGQGPHRPGPAAQEDAPHDQAPNPYRQAMDQGQPRSTGHDEDGGKEHDQDVLDHVHEEVVTGPIVDGRADRQQQDSQPAIKTANGGQRVP